MIKKNYKTLMNNGLLQAIKDKIRHSLKHQFETHIVFAMGAIVSVAIAFGYMTLPSIWDLVVLSCLLSLLVLPTIWLTLSIKKDQLESYSLLHPAKVIDDEDDVFDSEISEISDYSEFEAMVVKSGFIH